MAIDAASDMTETGYLASYGRDDTTESLAEFNLDMRLELHSEDTNFLCPAGMYSAEVCFDNRFTRPDGFSESCPSRPDVFI